MDDHSANPAAGSDSPTVSDPVDMIAGLLEREQAPTEKPRNQKPDPEPAPEPEEAPAEPGPEVPPEEGGEDEDGEAEAPEQQEEAEPELFVVKIDGKEQQVTREELLNGYQRDADYRQKTMALSQSRQAVEAEAQRIQAERQHYTTQLDQLATVLQAALPPQPTEQQLQEDPIGYLQQQKLWESRVQQLQSVLGERERVQQQMQQEQQQRHGQYLQAAREQLLEALPEWRDPETARKGQTELAAYLRTCGYSDAEIGAAADPRAVVAYRKAMLYDRLQASKPKIQQKLATAPRMVKPGAAGPAPDQRKAVIGQLKRSGGKDLDAAARLIELG